MTAGNLQSVERIGMFALLLLAYILCSLIFRVLSLLQQEHLRISVEQVIIQRCCKSLPVWTSSPGEDRDCSEAKKDNGAFSIDSLSILLQQHSLEHMSALGIIQPQSDASSESEASLEDLSAISTNLCTLTSSSQSHLSSCSYTFLLTPSALSFLKSHSPLLATLACLSACKGETPRIQSTGWSGYFRSGRKEVFLDVEQISCEAENFLKEFPVLRTYLHTMAEPVLGTPLNEGVEGSVRFGTVVCGKPLVSLLLSGPREKISQAVVTEAFQNALSARDLDRALRLLELYGQSCSQEGVLRDHLLVCAALEGRCFLTKIFMARLLCFCVSTSIMNTSMRSIFSILCILTYIQPIYVNQQ